MHGSLSVGRLLWTRACKDVCSRNHLTNGDLLDRIQALFIAGWRL